MKLAFIGGGNMARALLGGLLREGAAPGDLSVGEPLPAAREALQRDFAVRVTGDNAAAVAGAVAVVLAVKPQEMAAVLKALRPSLATPLPLLVSIAAGVRTRDIAAWCEGASVVRAMPNRPALVGAGATALYASGDVDAAGRSLAEQILRAAGRTVWVREEAELDIVTALSGSGPAYFLLLAEELANGAIALGLEPATARLLAAQTLYGTGMLAQSDPDLAAQRAAVTSKGGTTAAALASFAAQDFAGLVHRALKAAADRSAELGRN
ncbi:MAG TPA: pyrroline-5-carboxylate reductase [Steroidobacteraceae bacterium]|nr:pyrroline-5-carboxylate reductase [Steroidobacteraceae bacterium]